MKNYKKPVMIALIIVVSLLCVLYDFVTTSFNASIFADVSYWLKLIAINVAAIMVLFSTRELSKDNAYKSNEKIAEVGDALDAAYKDLNAVNRSKAFDEYLEKLNEAAKLNAYLTVLNRKLLKTKNGKKRKLLQDKISSAPSDVIYVKVKYPKLNASVIFSKTQVRCEQNDVDLHEGRAVAEILINKAAGLIAFSMVGMTIVVDAFTANVASALIGALFKLFQLGMALYTGYTSGTDFVNATVLAKMKQRLSIVQQFKEELKKEAPPKVG